MPFMQKSVEGSSRWGGKYESMTYVIVPWALDAEFEVVI